VESSKICILIASYNGAAYIEQQIESLQAQTLNEWILLVRDDGSSDTTREKLRRLAEIDSRINIIDSDIVDRLGSTHNFGRLMLAGLETNCHIFFFCDQDDVWEPDKLETQVAAFPSRGAESISLLVYSDLSVVDQKLELIHPSMTRFMSLDVDPATPFTSLLSRNYVTGCAMACNRLLLERALPVPREAIMHDWWLALVAAGTGSIEFIDRPLLKYRQHQSNVIGATGFWRMLNPLGGWLKRWQRGNREFISTFSQAHALLRHAEAYPEIWSSHTLEILQSYSSLLQMPLGRRMFEARVMGLRRGSLIFKFSFYLRLLTIRNGAG
jgi:glycosyltransferase involved in cell wall biosynthesis